MTVSESVEITGHLMDSGVLSRVLDDIREYDADWVIEHIDVGHDASDMSTATITVTADDDEALQRLLMRLQTRGVNMVDPGRAEYSPAEMDGVFPDGFYSTTNLPTRVRLDGRWMDVENPEMDCGLIVDGERVYTLPMADVKAGMNVVCGAAGIKVETPVDDRPQGGFGFMESDVSSEKPQAVLVRQVADGMREAKANGKKVLWVGGPGVVHTGAAPAMVALVCWLPQLGADDTATGGPASRRTVTVWHDPLAWHVTFYMGMQSLLFYGPLSWLPAIFRDRGVDPAYAGLLLLLFNGLGIVGNLTFPVVAARLPDQRGPVAVAIVLTTIGLLGVLLAPTSTALLWVIVLGIAQGASLSLALLAIVLRSPDPDTAAALSGMAQSGGYLLASLGPLVMGLLYTATGAWTMSLLFLLAVALAIWVPGLTAAQARFVRSQ